MSNDQYVFTYCPTAGGDLDPTSLRGRAIADAHVAFRRMIGDEVLFDVAADAAAVERWARWLLEKLDAAGRIYQREGAGWLLRSGKLHEESERRQDELVGWSEAALAEQRALLEHVDDPGDSGNELEQSLSKLAAAGWKVDAKKDKGPPTVHFAAGDMPLTAGDDWRAAGAVHPRLAAALAPLVAALAPGEPESAPPGEADEVARRLPALAVAGGGSEAALLDMRTIAKALRDVGGLELASGEPLGPVVVHGSLELGAEPDALTAAHGADAVRFALLHAAAPAKSFAGGADVVGYAATFLAELRDFAASRLDGSAAGSRIDPGDRLRRRLAGWCDTAVRRTAENYERLDMHRATRNVIALLARIRDFDARVDQRQGEVAGADREAVGVALALLAQLLAPLAPTAASELWQQAGRDGAPGDAAWPTAQRVPAAA